MARWSAVLVVGLVAIAGLVPAARASILVVVIVGFATTWAIGARPASGRPDREVLVAPWAAGCAVVTLLAWGTVPAPLASQDGGDCANAFSPPAAWRALEALLVLGVVGVLARIVGIRWGSVGLGRPGRAQLALAATIVVVLAPCAVLVGPWLAQPFFGTVSLPGAGEPGAIVPALLFGLANGTMEELLYRGVLPAWLGTALGRRPAILVAAVLFGLQHALGAEFTGSSLPVVATMTVSGLAASWIVTRTGSLAIPIAVHVALDVPLYYYWACRW